MAKNKSLDSCKRIKAHGTLDFSRVMKGTNQIKIDKTTDPEYTAKRFNLEAVDKTLRNIGPPLLALC